MHTKHPNSMLKRNPNNYLILLIEYADNPAAALCSFTVAFAHCRAQNGLETGGGAVDFQNRSRVQQNHRLPTPALLPAAAPAPPPCSSLLPWLRLATRQHSLFVHWAAKNFTLTLLSGHQAVCAYFLRYSPSPPVPLVLAVAVSSCSCISPGRGCG